MHAQKFPKFFTICYTSLDEDKVGFWDNIE